MLVDIDGARRLLPVLGAGERAAVTHALTAFIRARMDERGLRNRDVERDSGLSRQVVSKHVSDERDKLTRLPSRDTLDGFARALGVPTEFLVSKAVEALDLGYAAGDFINDVEHASDDELINELRRRLSQGRSDRVDVGFADRDVVSDLPTAREARELRERRLIEDAQQQDTAAYEGGDTSRKVKEDRHGDDDEQT